MGRRNQIVYPCRVEGWLNYYDKEIGPGTRLHDVEWEPYFCVLLQDEQTLTAYRSEELALFPGTIFGMRNRLKIGDALFVELPRVRLDGGAKAFRQRWGYEGGNALLRPPNGGG
ncbi:ras GTPase-activating protein raskol-like [Nilaparvata lugens]|uniref:ras GTPase-activating protein raskol-like n=1 Tax=Nilaparvata lugens TaxID=108931 RepID=UPI00193D608F|nr:ras GTPase-activating protein raskol-like [Nilaparvata lugens]